MGTRGLYGFRCDGRNYLAFENPAGPHALGADIAAELPVLFPPQQRDWQHQRDAARVTAVVRQLRLVEAKARPEEGEARQLRPIVGRWWRPPRWELGRPLEETWMDLLGSLRGSLLGMLISGVCIDDAWFFADPECEWAYIVNLEAGRFELHRGERAVAGCARFGLVGTWPLAKPPSADQIAAAAYDLGTEE